jgi:hypothetical protein
MIERSIRSAGCASTDDGQIKLKGEYDHGSFICMYIGGDTDSNNHLFKSGNNRPQIKGDYNMIKWKTNDKVKVVLLGDSHFGEIGTIDDVMVLGICVKFDDDSRQIYKKNGELIKQQNN